MRRGPELRTQWVVTAAVDGWIDVDEGGGGRVAGVELVDLGHGVEGGGVHVSFGGVLDVVLGLAWVGVDDVVGW